MGRLLVSRAWILAFVLLLVSPAVTYAGARLAPPCEGELLLPFGTGYTSSGATVVHRGLDIQAGEGAAVLAAASGTVSFAGQIPADGGGRVSAVTVTTDSGLLVSVSPLGSSSVCKGERVSVGDGIGVLAASGDDSVSSSHVHLSVRDGGVYVDPEPLLEQRAAADAPETIDEVAVAAGAPGETSPTSAATADPVAATGASTNANASGRVTGNSRAAAPDSVGSALGAQIAETVLESFSAEVARLRTRGSIVHTEGFVEPRLADSVAAMAIRPSLVVPAGGARLSLLFAGVGCLVAIIKLHRETAESPVLWRER